MSRWYCPVCGDAAAVYPHRERPLDPACPAGELVYLCNRGHRGMWTENARSARPAEWTMPDPERVEAGTKRAKERGG